MKDTHLYSILLVEDDADDRMFAEEYLREKIADPQITYAASFTEAAKILQAPHSSFDIVLLDLGLPDKSGQELLTAMLEVVHCNTPIIVLTGFDDTAFGVSTISQCVCDYLLKGELNASILYKSIVYALERQKTLLHLRKSEHQYSDLFDLSPQPMWIYDEEAFKFKKVNKAAIEKYGYTKNEFLKLGLIDIKAPTDTLENLRFNMSKRHREGIYNGHYMHRKKNGEIIYVDVSGAPIIFDNRNYILVVATDITEATLQEHAITRAIIKAQEDERYEIGAELHDNVCQILATSLMTLGALKKSLPGEESTYYTQSKLYISTALEEIRNLSHQLAPASLSKITLQEAFLKLFRNVNVEDRYKIILHIDKKLQNTPISPDIQLNLYRILQEQLRNIHKYAKATVIKVELNVQQDIIEMRITDNGKGFNVQEVKPGIGFANIKRRAELSLGRSEVIAEPEKGCTVKIRIPFLLKAHPAVAHR